MFGDDFGNTFLDKLQEISLPAPVAWTPQTIGWYVLAALAAIGLLWMLRAAYRRHAANRYRRAALAELATFRARLDGETGPSRVLADIAALLKRTALAVFPREEVAGLSGEAWLGFLDSAASSTDFSSGPGRILADLPYSPAATAPPAGDVRELLTVSRRWIRRHRHPRGGK